MGAIVPHTLTPIDNTRRRLCGHYKPPVPVNILIVHILL
jgi:hypothetical protein